jgi:hypothetical protein
VLRRALRSVALRVVKPIVGDRWWRRLRRWFAFLAPRPTLTQLAISYRTDKWGSHRYTPHYERHLGHLRDERFTLLEIGIGGYRRPRSGGGSLRMWRAFFPKARIAGLDVEDKTFLDGDRLRTYRGSQADGELLRRIVEETGDLRVVIDDGSHHPTDVRTSFEVLFPLLEDGGIYAIEDTQTSYWPEFGGSEDRSDPSTTMALVKDLLDGLNHEEFLDEPYEATYSDRHVVGLHAYHNLVVIEKGHNVEGSNKRQILRRRYATPRPEAD